jgi:pimeloyl-ACP methyl ester carboxylesterase
MDACARDVLALLDTLGVERAVWAGHSMGGYITMATLRIAPERIAGVALVATHPHPDTDDKRAGRLATAQRVLDEGSTVVADSMRPIMFAPDFDTGSAVGQTSYDLMCGTAPAGVAGALRGMAERPDSMPTLRDLAVPAVVIAGADDQIVDLDIARHMVNAMPGGTSLVLIGDSGHMPMLEQPVALTGALRTFLVAGGW